MIRAGYRKFKDLFLHHILHVDDTPERIARGAAAGIFVAWTPTFGMQTVIAIAAAALVRGNKAAVIPMVWVTNPLTNPAIYTFSYLVGHFLMTGEFRIDPAMRAKALTLMKETMLLDIWDASFWSRLWDVTKQIGLELWVGSCVVGLVVAAVTYPLVLRAVVGYRKHRAAHKPADAPANPEHKSENPL
jgi:uncharacterized protein